MPLGSGGKVKEPSDAVKVWMASRSLRLSAITSACEMGRVALDTLPRTCRTAGIGASACAAVAARIETNASALSRRMIRIMLLPEEHACEMRTRKLLRKRVITAGVVTRYALRVMSSAHNA